MSAARPTSSAPIVSAKDVVAAPPEVLQHVAVVVDARLVDPDRGGDAGGLELVERGDTRAQSEIR